jgi:hypothetical protein
MRPLAAAVLLAACATPTAGVPAALGPSSNAPRRDDARAARELLRRFLGAVEASRFDEVHGLLAQPLRARYSVERLARDFAADPSVTGRLARVRAALERDVNVNGDAADVALAGGRHLRAVREDGQWRVVALEE